MEAVVALKQQRSASCFKTPDHDRVEFIARSWENALTFQAPQYPKFAEFQLLPVLLTGIGVSHVPAAPAVGVAASADQPADQHMKRENLDI